MGLAISRSIIEAHGGRLWATANAPHGAVVSVYVADRWREDGMTEARRMVFVVDDDASMRDH